MRSWPVYSGLNKHKIDKIINSQITTHTHWIGISALLLNNKSVNQGLKSQHEVCARCAEQRGPDLGGKLKKLEWITYIGALENTDRSFENKLDRESGSGFFPVQADPILICIFLLISAADPIQISDRDIPTVNIQTVLSFRPGLCWDEFM